MHLDPTTPAFINWIISFGSGVKVVAPRSLRKNVYEKDLAIYRKYK